MKKFILALAALLSLTGCKNITKTLLPNVSGKAGEIIVVIDKDNWEGALGTEVRDLLACDCPFLVQREPLYSLINVAPGSFADLFKVHRNIVIFNIDPSVESAGLLFKQDVWSAPQCVIQVSAADSESAVELLKNEGHKIVAAVEQAERDRVIENSKKYEERSIAPVVKERFGGSLRFPNGFKLKKTTDDFVWIADEKQYTMEGIFVYKYPVGENPFDLQSIISHRNEILKENVPGMFDNTYMTTGDVFPPTVEYVHFRGRDFAQTRGFWEVANDFMGGPFVSHSFYSADGSEIIVLDAFVYAPKYDKRQYLRQVESILYSWYWVEGVKSL
ncbi:MAG: DUF4837 family protein [Bacteroidales bacterium]|nr:DUF4837 family protein [Bacteroidales bacterium]